MFPLFFPRGRTLRRVLLFLLLIAVPGAIWVSVRRLLPLEVPVTAVARGTAVLAVYATGTVEPVVMLPIAPRVGGHISSLDVDEGAKVVQGQLLAQLEDNDLRAALLEQRSRESRAEADYQRNLKLIKEKAISAQEFERSKTDWESAAAATKTALAQANFTKLLAPSEGRIIRRDGEIGQFIPVNQPVFWFASSDELRITAEVDEEDISSVKPGQQVVIRADAFSDQVFYGSVQSITPKGDPILRSYRVRISLVQPHPLKIGMTSETNIIVKESKDALLVPATALDGPSVWQIEQGKLRQRQVTTGVFGLERVEVLSGLSEGELVVVDPKPLLEIRRPLHPRVLETAEVTP